MAVAIAMYAGARHVVITDANDYRLELARKVGATLALNVQSASLDDAMKTLSMDEGFHVGMEMSGNLQAFRDMIRTMHHGGKFAILRIPPNKTSIKWKQVIFKELELKGIYGREMFEPRCKISNKLQSGLNIEPIRMHNFTLGDFQEAFELIESGQSSKVILQWN